MAFKINKHNSFIQWYLRYYYSEYVNGNTLIMKIVVAASNILTLSLSPAVCQATWTNKKLQDNLSTSELFFFVAVVS